MYLGLNSAVWSYGPPIEIVGCITSHAQITTTTYCSGAVNSEVAHLIMVCWAFLLQSFGAEQIGDTRWPTKVFAHACVEIKSISTPFMCVSSRHKTLITTVSLFRLKHYDDDDDDDDDDDGDDDDHDDDDDDDDYDDYDDDDDHGDDDYYDDDDDDDVDDDDDDHHESGDMQCIWG